MRVDIPITVLFDCDGLPNTLGKRPDYAVITWRVDKDDTNDAGRVCAGYPAKPGAFWMDAAGPGEFLPSRAWDAILKRIAEDPETYEPT